MRWTTGTALVAALFLTACGGDIDVADGKGVREGGIGGTGIVLAHSEGGIGGTGAPVWAAALGTVTGFGSIHVNGLRVIFPGGTALTPDGRLFREQEVDLGETVEIVGEVQSDGTVTARYAMVRPALVGTLRISAEGRITVDGKLVTLATGAPIVDRSGSKVALKDGDQVAVSGLPRRGEIVASRIERVTADTAESVPKSLLTALVSPVEKVVVEGYLISAPSTARGLAIDGFEPPVDPGSRLAVVGPGRALFIGTLDEGVFTVRHGLPLPEDTAARREKLEAVGDAFAPAGALETR